MHTKSILVSGTALILPVLAHAAPVTGTAQFNGIVAPSCIVVVGTPGVLDLATNGTELTTKTGLGMPAVVAVTTTGTTYQVSVANATSFALAPSGGNAGTTFDTSWSSSGASIYASVAAGVSRSLSLGITSLSINLTARHPTPFPAGIYNAQTVVTCE